MTGGNASAEPAIAEQEEEKKVDSTDSDDEDVSSGWSAQDSIDREIKEMRKLERKKARKEKKENPPKLMIEKELKKDELGVNERQRLKEIVTKGKARPPSGRVAYNTASAKDAEKIAQEIIN